jgi:hypothetical protein
MLEFTRSGARATSGRGGVAAISMRTRGCSVVTTAGTDADMPEWRTERWKHRVEAEARQRLERNIRGVAAAR